MTDIEKAKILKSTEKLWNERNRLADLEKENAELKAQIEELQLNLRSRNDLVEELTMQIEGMKNVGNCNKAMKCSKWVEQHMQGNKVMCCCGCVEWEKTE